MESKGDAAEASLGPALERLTALQAGLEAHAQALAHPAAPPTSGPPAAAAAGSPRAARRWPPPLRPDARRWLVPAVGALAVAAGLALYLAAPRAPEPVPGLLVRAQEPTVVGLQGDVQVWRAGARAPVAVRGAVVVGADDRVQAAADGRASITWPRGAVATLDPNSAVMLLPGHADDVVRIQLTEGSLWLDSGAEPGALAVEALTPDGARVAGRRFQVQRDAGGRLAVATTDARATVTANDGRQELPPGSTSEVLVGRQPALPRSALVPRAVAIAVDGPAGWVVVDRLGRAVGQPPEGGGWLDQLPAVRGPLSRERGAAAILPDPAGEYQVLLWGSEAARSYRLALWPTDGQALYGGPAPREAADAVRQEGEIPANGRVTLRFTVQGPTVAWVGAPRPAGALPAWVRAVVPAGPRLVAAPSATVPATRAPIIGRPPQPPAAAPPADAAPDATADAAPAVADAASAGPAEGGSATVAAALAAMRAAPAASAAPTEVVAVVDDSAPEPAPEPVATAAVPSFGMSIPGVPRDPPATRAPTPVVAPVAVVAPPATPTALMLQPRPLVPDTDPLAPVAAPALSGTMTASRGATLSSPPDGANGRLPAVPPGGVVQSPPARAVGNGASAPPGALPQSIPPGGLTAAAPPGYAAGAAGGTPPGAGARSAAGAPTEPLTGPAPASGGIAGTPAEYTRPVAAAAPNSLLDAGNRSVSGATTVAPSGYSGGAASAASAAPTAPAGSLSTRSQGTIPLSGTLVPAAAAVQAAPPLTNNRGAATVLPGSGAFQATPAPPANRSAVTANRAR